MFVDQGDLLLLGLKISELMLKCGFLFH
jgi:hypothetical protein